MSATDHLYVFIMAGGSGERFWPLSRQETPKHLLNLFSEHTLLEQTVRRLEGLIPLDRIYVLTNAQQREGTIRVLPFLDPSHVVVEPVRRDTAPAVALATGIVHHRDPEAVMALLPADHLIADEATYRRNLSDALEQAARGDSVVTLGIRPTYPSTGFGYLELGEEWPRGTSGSVIRKVERFVEKPSLEKAQEYLKQGRYVWNGGMFAWKTRYFLDQLRRTSPELADFVESFPSGDFTAYIQEKFPGLTRISIDYAVMEKVPSVTTVMAEFDWDDVGAWTSIPAHLPLDAAGNTLQGKIVSVDSQRTIAIGTGRLIALCGVSDLVVVETPDALLVCHRDKVQDIKKLFPHLPPEMK